MNRNLSRRRPHHTVALAAIATLLASLLLSFEVPAPAAAAGTIAHNTSTKTITFSGTDYSATFRYDNRAVITSLKLGGYETLNPGHGIYSAVNNGSWTTTQILGMVPTVTIAGSTATVGFTTAVGSETWTLTANDSNLAFKLSRTYGGSGALQQQGTPMMNFAEHSFDSIRWGEDGGSWPLGGALLNQHQPTWFATGANLSSGREERTGDRFGLGREGLRLG